MINQNYPRGEKEFSKWLVREYLKYGSVDEVYRLNDFSIPVSNANYHRILDRWGIIKAAGPNSALSEIINFLYRMVEEGVPMDKLYKKMPHTFQVSAVTLYRILGYIKEGITRRMGTALIIHPFNDVNKILIGREAELPRLGTGEVGAYTIPMTFSKKTDMREDAILRVLQHEVFSDLAIEKQNLEKFIPTRPKPFMYLDVADVRVEVFDITLPYRLKKTKNFSSYKLTDYKFMSVDEIASSTFEKKLFFRSGVIEAIKGYKKYLSLKNRNLSFNPIQEKTTVNYFLAENLRED